MSCTVSAADANRQFSEILGQATRGQTVIITKRGQPVAQLTPYGRPVVNEGSDPAWSRLFNTLDNGVNLGGGRFDRDAVYDR